MQCPRCQQDNPPQAKFCLECGNRLVLTCAQCGTELPAGAKFCLECGQPVGAGPAAPSRFMAPEAYTPKHLAEKILTARGDLEGERKQVTVLFADIKGSTELIGGLDPEEARKLLDPALHSMMEAVHRYEGTVNQVLGDGIMALFGAPIAHEDHAARACYAALAMQAALRRYAEEVRRAQGLLVQIRVGLNSGEVVVRTIGNDLHMDYSAVGQTTHLAARMEQLAAPGSILLTGATLRLVEGLVQVNALGPTPIKGLTEPVNVCELLGVTAFRRRLQATAARGLTRFVGRQHELESLRQTLEQAAAGHGQVVAAVGEAGVGKSRLAYEFVRSHHLRGWLVLEGASVSYGKATPYFPVIDLLKRYCHLEDSDDARTIRAKGTGQVLTLDEALQETIPALLALLDALPEQSPFAKLEPPQRRQRTLDALKRLFLRESQVQPVLLVFEDLHWIDAETQALLDILVESLPTARLLLLVNYRPEYQHSWGRKTYYTQLRLDPLPPASAEEFLEVLLGEDSSLEPLTRLLIARTEGNPFFLEESVRTLVEAGVLVGTPCAYRLAQALPTIQVPATVQAVLAARIDRLPAEEKRLLQTAAVIGTEVPLPLLRAIAELPEEGLYRGLSHLQSAEFLYETSLFPEISYTFKHALTHEVAYGGLLIERRRVLHARIVNVLETLYADRLAEQVERLAHHALRGEVWDKAVTYCRQAGDKALMRSAYHDAVTYGEQALAALTHLPERHDTRAYAIDLRLELHFALTRLGAFGRTLVHLREAEALAEALGDPSRRAQVASTLARACWWVGDPKRALEAGQRARAIVTALDDVALRGTTLYTHFCLGQAYNALGDYPRAIDCFARNVACLDRESVSSFDPRSSIHGSFDAVLSQAWLARSLAEMGAFAAGKASATAGVRIAETVAHPFSFAIAAWGIGLLALRQGHAAAALPVLERGLEGCHSRGLEGMFPWVAAPLGAVYARTGRLSEALPLLAQAVERAATCGIFADQALRVAWLSEAYLLTNQGDQARQLAERALELSHTHQERGNQAWVRWLLGQIEVHHDLLAGEPAKENYRQALTLAEELGMRPLQAHCHLGLGTLYSKIGRVETARAELSAAIALYRAMDMTFWLPEAETALVQVG